MCPDTSAVQGEGKILVFQILPLTLSTLSSWHWCGSALFQAGGVCISSVFTLPV